MAKADDKSNTSDKVSTVDEKIGNPRSRRLTWREAWWPLAVAVAWVLLRSQQVVEQLLNRHSRKPITLRYVAIAAADLKASGQHPTPKFENSDAAFDELRHHMETGEIEIVGTPFVRVSDLEGSSRLEMEDQQTIPFSKMSSLVRYDDHGELCLIPRDWHKAHGGSASARTYVSGYRNILARSSALVESFPPIDPPAPDATLFGDGAPVEERTQLDPSDAVARAEPTKPEVPALVPPVAVVQKMGPAKWQAWSLKEYRQQPDDRSKIDHLRRLHLIMQTAPNVTKPWKEFETFRRNYFRLPKSDR